MEFNWLCTWHLHFITTINEVEMKRKNARFAHVRYFIIFVTGYFYPLFRFIGQYKRTWWPRFPVCRQSSIQFRSGIMKLQFVYQFTVLDSCHEFKWNYFTKILKTHLNLCIFNTSILTAKIGKCTYVVKQSD